jgi:hypothetical protein
MIFGKKLMSLAVMLFVSKKLKENHLIMHTSITSALEDLATLHFLLPLEVLVALSPSGMAICSLGNVSAPPDFMLLLN